jgi:predicted metal-dependent phosphoesterase TrpH
MLAQNYIIKNKLNLNIVIGEEISTSNGHLIGLFLKYRIEPHLSAEETIREIHKQDGIAICPHPYHVVYHRKNKHKPMRHIFRKLDFDAVETNNNAFFLSPIINFPAIFKTEQFAKIGSSDSHMCRFIGKGYTIFPVLGNNIKENFKQSILNKTTISKRKKYTLFEVLYQLKHSFAVYRSYYNKKI